MTFDRAVTVVVLALSVVNSLPRLREEWSRWKERPRLAAPKAPLRLVLPADWTAETYGRCVRDRNAETGRP